MYSVFRVCILGKEGLQEYRCGPKFLLGSILALERARWMETREKTTIKLFKKIFLPVIDLLTIKYAMPLY